MRIHDFYIPDFIKIKKLIYCKDRIRHYNTSYVTNRCIFNIWLETSNLYSPLIYEHLDIEFIRLK